MDVPPAWSQACICGRTFSVPQAYTCHVRSCLTTKKWLSSALLKAKDVFQVNKCHKIEDAAWQEATETSGPPVPEPHLNQVNFPSHQQVSFLISLSQVLYLVRSLRSSDWHVSGWNEAMTRSLEERISIRLRTSVHQWQRWCIRAVGKME